MRRSCAAVLLLALLLGGGAAARAEQPVDDAHAVHQPAQEFIPAVAGEGALLNRLMAPCCWKGTLEGHHSPMVEELKQEVRRRLLAGEAPEAIEADFIGRYGDKVRAVPAGWDLDSAFGWYAAGLVLSGAAMIIIGRRWRRRQPEDPVTPAPPTPGAPDRAQLEDRLDEELSHLQ